RERVTLGEDAVVVGVAVLAVDGERLADGDVLRQVGVGGDRALPVVEDDRRADGLAGRVALLAVGADRQQGGAAARAAAAVAVAIAAGRPVAVVAPEGGGDRGRRGPRLLV